jgi:hypothetical protein
MFKTEEDECKKAGDTTFTSIAGVTTFLVEGATPNPGGVKQKLCGLWVRTK